MGEITARDKADAAKREVKYRQHVYGRRVAYGKMTQKLADYQVAVMQSIFDDYEKIAEAEEQAGRLL